MHQLKYIAYAFLLSGAICAYQVQWIGIVLFILSSLCLHYAGFRPRFLTDPVTYVHEVLHGFAAMTCGEPWGQLVVHKNGGLCMVGLPHSRLAQAFIFSAGYMGTVAYSWVIIYAAYTPFWQAPLFVCTALVCLYAIIRSHNLYTLFLGLCFLGVTSGLAVLSYLNESSWLSWFLTCFGGILLGQGSMLNLGLCGDIARRSYRPNDVLPESRGSLDPERVAQSLMLDSVLVSVFYLVFSAVGSIWLLYALH